MVLNVQSDNNIIAERGRF